MKCNINDRYNKDKLTKAQRREMHNQLQSAAELQMIGAIAKTDKEYTITTNLSEQRRDKL